ncbi:ABC-three component system protein [Methylobacterium sp. 285MFTsu5.1]|uniref:ABC-three component system protein n=1 Tax=Methylobacterium sp. 285MFTsu5.1 TaxID=1172187 RepID=UPI000363DE0F|nr:ABC-three component system protein [Methylobacterium sp. 285MFTsu5.1]
MISDYVTAFFKMDPAHLEAFVADWLNLRRHVYVDWTRCSGAGDGGRDVVGFETNQRYEGPWTNFQCKLLRRNLSVTDAVRELGKIFMHVAAGNFTLPTKYVFVAPKGTVRTLSDLVGHPEKFRRTVIERWDAVCRDHLVKGQATHLTPEIRAVVEAFDFTGVSVLDGAKLAAQEDIGPALVRWFGADPGPLPSPEALPAVSLDEAPYLAQLAAAYGARAELVEATTDDILAHPKYGEQLRDQRLRYFHASRFGRLYRKRVFEDVLVAFDEEIYHGVVDTHRDDGHRDALAQVNAVMRVAPLLTLTGPLRDHASAQVKQGTCHRFANEGRLPWGI